MATSIEDLVNEFYNLEGTTVKEKTKNLYVYLKKLRNEGTEIIDSVISNITPKYYLQSIFHVDMLVYFKKFENLLSMLQTDNVVLIKKIVKHNWFHLQVIETKTPKQLVSEVFSRVSYTTRMRLLNNLVKLCKNESYTDDLYEAYCSEYGVKQASILLPICSNPKVKEILSKSRLNLSAAYLLRLTKKDPRLLLDYLKSFEVEYRRACPFNKYSHVMKCIAVRDVKTLKELIYLKPIVLSRRNTERFLKVYKNEVVEDQFLCRYLDPKQLTKSLGGDFFNLYLNQFPKSLVGLENIREWHVVFKYVNHLKPKRKMSLFLRAYEKVFRSSLYENPKLLSNYLLDLTEDVKLREKWIKLHENYENYIIYLPCAVSVPALKEKLKLTADPFSRGSIIRSLVDTCLINKNMSELIELGKFIAQRYRNDLEGVISAFLNKMDTSLKLEELNTEHWTYLSELFAVYKLKAEKTYNLPNYLEKYLHHCYLNGLPLRETFIDCLKLNNRPLSMIAGKPFEKMCLELSVDLYPEIYGNERSINDVKLLKSILSFNVTHPNDEIQLERLQRLFDALEENIREKDYRSEILEIFKILFLKRYYVPEKIVKIYWDVFPDYIDDEMCVWFLLNDPEMIVEKFKTLKSEKLNSLISDLVFIWLLENDPQHLLSILKSLKNPPSMVTITKINIGNLCRKYSKTPLIENLLKKCEKSFQSTETQLKTLAIKYFSVILPSQEFDVMIKLYYPEESVLDARKPNVEKQFEVQLEICKDFKNPTDKCDALKCATNFCMGDYLKISLPALYHLAYNTAEDKILDCLGILNTHAISVRKHFFFLCSILLRGEQVYESLKGLVDSEGNPAMIKILLMICYKYFCKNPDGKFWDLIKVLIVKLDINDKETFEMLVELNNLPKIYYANFIEHIWNVLESNENKNSTIDKSLKFTLLNKVKKETMLLLDDEFCDKIVRNHFLAIDRRFHSFFINYIFYSKNQNERFQLISTLFHDYKKTNSDNEFLVTETVQNFISIFFAIALQQENLNTDFLKSFERLWSNIADEIKIFTSLIKLRAITLHFESTGSDIDYLENFAGKFALYLDELEGKYGLPMILLNYVSIQYVIFQCREGKVKHATDDENFKFARQLFFASKSVACCFVAVKILKKPESVELLAEYDDLIEMIGGFDEVFIKSCLFTHLKNVNFNSSLV